MPDTMNDEADRYVRRLLWALQPLPHDDRLAIAGEIHGHLVESGAGGPVAMARAVARLGPPDRLARSYVEDFELTGAVNRAAPGPLLLAMMTRGTRNAAALLAGSASVLCYLFALAFLITALAKLVTPDHVGFWLEGERPSSFGIAAAGGAPGAREVLGWVIVPLAAVLALGCYTAGSVLLRRVARALLARA